MTKKTFEELKVNEIYCRSCNRMLPKSSFCYSYVTKDASASRCKFCDWVIRHNGIPKNDNYDENILKNILEDMIFERVKYLNELADKYNLQLDKVIDIIKFLHIGNKKFSILSKCKECGNPIEVILSVYEKNENLFCNYQCYWKFKKEHALHGKYNGQYSRIKTNCTNCNKEIEVIPYDYNKKNLYGDNHNFCSQKCYWEYRSKYYIGEKSVTSNRIITDEEREKMRITVLKNLGKADRLNSKIQLSVNDILDKNNIKYDREHIVKYYSIDNYLIEYDLIIEVMGDYWHTSPLKYGKDKYLINNMQRRGITRDKQKYSYIKNHLNIEILYLWERDIEKQLDKCEALILKYVHENGILQDYNSFNYSFVNNHLILNENIIIPYQKRSADEINTITKPRSA